MLRPGRRGCATWTRTGRRRRCRSPTSRASAGRRSSRRDRELALLCVRAYNDWMVEEWCGGSDGRLVPLCIVPLWDPQLAAAEVERNAARGVRAVCFSEIPAYLGLPSIHSGEWDPFFAACEATGTVLGLHIGSGSKMPSTSADAPLGVPVTIGFGNCMNSLADWLFSGKLTQFPRPAAAVRREPDRLDPVPARAGRRRLEAAQGVGGDGRRDQRATVDLLLPPGVRLLLPRLPRGRVDRVVRCRQRDVRGRLPALRLDLARQPRGRGGRHGRPRSRRRAQARARQRDPGLRARLPSRVVARRPG